MFKVLVIMKLNEKLALFEKLDDRNRGKRNTGLFMIYYGDI